MKKNVFFACFLFIAMIYPAISFADISTEIVGGASVIQVKSLWEKNIYQGTIETIRVASGGFYFQLRDTQNNAIKRYPANGDYSGIFGTIDPVLNNQGEIEKFRCLISSGVSTTQMWVLNLDRNINYLSHTTGWPTASTNYYYASSIVTFSDGSYMAVGYNNAGVYMNKFNADDTPAWAQMKTLDMSGLSDWTVPSIGDLSVEKMDDDNIIIAMTGRGHGNQDYDNIFFNINGEGVNNCPPVRIDNGNLEDMLGDIAVDENGIHVMSSAYGSGIDVAYYLHLDPEDLRQLSIYEFSDPNLVPFDISIDPDGIIYVAGGYGYYSGTGNGDGLFGWVNSLSPDQYEWFIKDFGGTIDGSFKAVDWTPDGAIFGGSDHAGNAWRGVYADTSNTDPNQKPIPEPSTIFLLGTGLLFLARTCRRKS